MIVKRLWKLAALLMIGDGMVGLLQSERHFWLWEWGPKPYRELMRSFLVHPMATRLVSGAEALLGLWLASRQRKYR